MSLWKLVTGFVAATANFSVNGFQAIEMILQQFLLLLRQGQEFKAVLVYAPVPDHSSHFPRRR